MREKKRRERKREREKERERERERQRKRESYVVEGNLFQGLWSIFHLLV